MENNIWKIIPSFVFFPFASFDCRQEKLFNF